MIIKSTAINLNRVDEETSDSSAMTDRSVASGNWLGTGMIFLIPGPVLFCQVVVGVDLPAVLKYFNRRTRNFRSEWL